MIRELSRLINTTPAETQYQLYLSPKVKDRSFHVETHNFHAFFIFIFLIFLGGRINHAYDKSFFGGLEKACVEVASFFWRLP